MNLDTAKFARLGRPKRLWAVAAAHSQVDRLMALHDVIGERYEPGERLIYLGNMIGVGAQVCETVEELLQFRRALLALPGMLADDIVYLRGAQEEMWQKLLQLQFAPNPTEVLTWMLAQGVDATLAGYGGRAREGMGAAREGAIQLTRWTNSLREAMRSMPGHTSLFAALKRAAFTDEPGLLAVSAGLDTSRPLAAQGDSFWWATGRFAEIAGPYETFVRMIRGFDPAGGGVQVGEFTATLDAGCGRGGPLVAGLFEPDGTLADLIEA
ncbi:MAG: hypothetical protein H6842_10450 [Rhodospirillaceae bacterium]|nr:hypothetical protein [Rhodospirillaceae bacterium]